MLIDLKNCNVNGKFTRFILFLLRIHLKNVEFKTSKINTYLRFLFLVLSMCVLDDGVYLAGKKDIQKELLCLP